MASHGGRREGAGRPRSTVPAKSSNGHTDPLEYLREVMQTHYDDRMRIEAAKAMLPYCHAKKGELGKKEVQQQEAEQTQAASPYKAAQPPLRMVK